VGDQTPTSPVDTQTGTSPNDGYATDDTGQVIERLSRLAAGSDPSYQISFIARSFHSAEVLT